MADDYIIGIGTVGAGLWLGYAEGRKWRHVQHGPPIESNCRALAVDPRRPGTIWAGADRIGMFRSTDHGTTWSRVGNPIGKPIWSIGLDPHDDQRLYLGTSPGIHRTKDGGESFHELTTSISAECPIGLSRTTNVVVDPTDADMVWASVEVDGLHRSADRGETWASLGQLGPDAFHNDVHGFATTPTAEGYDVLVTTPFGLGRSADRGASFGWRPFDPFPGSKLDVAYSRCVQTPWEGVVVVCVGDFVPGRIGALEISRDGGASWRRESLPLTPNSTMYWLATHPELDDTIVASSLFGQVYVSDDRAATWRKLDREFGEIRSVVVTPGP
jgi:Sortilin, neurotensin receptor 3,